MTRLDLDQQGTAHRLRRRSVPAMAAEQSHPPGNGAHAMIRAERAARLEAEAKFANARAEDALITYYKLEIEKLRRQLYGTRSERKARLLEQMELELEELETSDGDGTGGVCRPALKLLRYLFSRSLYQRSFQR